MINHPPWDTVCLSGFGSLAELETRDAFPGQRPARFGAAAVHRRVCAGYGIQNGPSCVDCKPMPPEDARCRFNVNLFGIADVTRLVLPLMGGGHRRLRHGS
jgi:NAD(P)-dependent dehydrogenase (short-subunit alcohol dehydrogenase family)